MTICLALAAGDPTALPNRAELEVQCKGGVWVPSANSDMERYPKCRDLLSSQSALRRQIESTLSDQSALVERYQSRLKAVEAAESDVKSHEKSFLGSLAESPVEKRKRQHKESAVARARADLTRQQPSIEAKVQQMGDEIRRLEAQDEKAEEESARCKADSERLGTSCAELAKVQAEEHQTEAAHQEALRVAEEKQEQREQAKQDARIQAEREKKAAVTRQKEAARRARMEAAGVRPDQVQNGRFFIVARLAPDTYEVALEGPCSGWSGSCPSEQHAILTSRVRSYKSKGWIRISVVYEGQRNVQTEDGFGQSLPVMREVDF